MRKLLSKNEYGKKLNILRRINNAKSSTVCDVQTRVLILLKGGRVNQHVARTVLELETGVEFVEHESRVINKDVGAHVLNLQSTHAIAFEQRVSDGDLWLHRPVRVQHEDDLDAVVEGWTARVLVRFVPLESNANAIELAGYRLVVERRRKEPVGEGLSFFNIFL